MPQKLQYHEPDAIDCNTMVAALAGDFSVICDISTRYGSDVVQVVVKTYRLCEGREGVVQVQAMVQAPLKSRRSLYTLQYSALLDCWHQLDRGVLAAATRPVERGWDGRPKQPAKHAS